LFGQIKDPKRCLHYLSPVQVSNSKMVLCLIHPYRALSVLHVQINNLLSSGLDTLRTVLVNSFSSQLFHCHRSS